MSKRPVSVEDFAIGHNFVCPFCGFKISDRRKTTLMFVEQTGEHYSACYQAATPEKRREVIDGRK